jgi:hypothetical protein
MNKILLTTLGILFSGAAQANATKPISLQLAIKSRLVSVTALGTGCYSGQCMNLSVTNLTGKHLNLNVDPAMIFKPVDTNYQNLVVVGDEQIDLQPCEWKTVALQTFCGKSYAHCPSQNLQFNFWKQGDSVMIKTVLFIKQNNYYYQLGQFAIWSLTNHMPLSNIYYAGSPEDSKKFVVFEANLRHLPVPEYYSTYTITSETNTTNHYNTQSHSSNRTVRTTNVVAPVRTGKQYVELNFKTDPQRNVYLVIITENGEVYNNNRVIEAITGTDHRIRVMFDESKDNKGRYIVMLRNDDNTILDKKTVVVGEDWE